MHADAVRPAPTDLDAALYRELRVLARARLRHGGRQTLLDTHALVHEAWMRMGKVQLQNRHQWMAYASRTMRSVIVDMARRRLAERRGGDALVVTWTEGLQVRADAPADEVLRVHDAIDALQRLEPRLAQVVEMRYFGGLDDVEIGDALGLSDRTVRREWDKARLLLGQWLQD